MSSGKSTTALQKNTKLAPAELTPNQSQPNRADTSVNGAESQPSLPSPVPVEGPEEEEKPSLPVIK